MVIMMRSLSARAETENHETEKQDTDVSSSRASSDTSLSCLLPAASSGAIRPSAANSKGPSSPVSCLSSSSSSSSHMAASLLSRSFVSSPSDNRSNSAPSERPCFLECATPSAVSSHPANAQQTQSSLYPPVDCIDAALSLLTAEYPPLLLELALRPVPAAKRLSENVGREMAEIVCARLVSARQGGDLCHRAEEVVDETDATAAAVEGTRVKANLSPLRLPLLPNSFITEDTVAATEQASTSTPSLQPGRAGDDYHDDDHDDLSAREETVREMAKAIEELCSGDGFRWSKDASTALREKGPPIANSTQTYEDLNNCGGVKALVRKVASNRLFFYGFWEQCVRPLIDVVRSSSISDMLVNPTDGKIKVLEAKLHSRSGDSCFDQTKRGVSAIRSRDTAALERLRLGLSLAKQYRLEMVNHVEKLESTSIATLDQAVRKCLAQGTTLSCVEDEGARADHPEMKSLILQALDDYRLKKEKAFRGAQQRQRQKVETNRPQRAELLRRLRSILYEFEALLEEERECEVAVASCQVQLQAASQFMQEFRDRCSTSADAESDNNSSLCKRLPDMSFPTSQQQLQHTSSPPTTLLSHALQLDVFATARNTAGGALQKLLQMVVEAARTAQTELENSHREMFTELPRNAVRMEALMDVLDETAERMLSAKRSVIAETYTKLRRKHQKLYYIVDAGDPEELAEDASPSGSRPAKDSASPFGRRSSTRRHSCAEDSWSFASQLQLVPAEPQATSVNAAPMQENAEADVFKNDDPRQTCGDPTTTILCSGTSSSQTAPQGASDSLLATTDGVSESTVQDPTADENASEESSAFQQQLAKFNNLKRLLRRQEAELLELQRIKEELLVMRRSYVGRLNGFVSRQSMTPLLRGEEPVDGSVKAAVKDGNFPKRSIGSASPDLVEEAVSSASRSAGDASLGRDRCSANYFFPTSPEDATYEQKSPEESTTTTTAGIGQTASTLNTTAQQISLSYENSDSARLFPGHKTNAQWIRSAEGLPPYPEQADQQSSKSWARQLIISEASPVLLPQMPDSILYSGGVSRAGEESSFGGALHWELDSLNTESSVSLSGSHDYVPAELP